MHEPTALVLELWRRGVTIRRLPCGRKIRLSPSWPLTDALIRAARMFKPVLLRRLAKPKGWPRWLPLPEWWHELAPAFEIVRAKPCRCPGCRYPVAVQWLSAAGPRWNCPQCGRPAESEAEISRETWVPDEKQG